MNVLKIETGDVELMRKNKSFKEFINLSNIKNINTTEYVIIEAKSIYGNIIKDYFR